MYCSSGVSRNVVSMEACPKMRVPFEGFSCDVSEPRFDALARSDEEAGSGSG